MLGLYEMKMSQTGKSYLIRLWIGLDIWSVSFLLS